MIFDFKNTIDAFPDVYIKGGVYGMIEMPPSYEDICKARGTIAQTIYHLPENPHRESSWYEEANITLHSMGRGVFYLYYMLRSYPRPTDDRRYNILCVTKQGLFVSVTSHSCMAEPIDFEVLRFKHWCHFGHRDLITLKPNTRELLILYCYRFTEIIDGKGYPNRFYFGDHPEMEKKITEHKILLESPTIQEPILVDFNWQMYDALHHGDPYIWVRKDNYIDMNQVRFVRQPY